MKSFRRESILYSLAFILALTVRFIKLGAMPLTDVEAHWALQALGIAQGAHPALGSQPAYVLLTSILFFAYGGGTNFLARLIPALTGSALALVPYLFRERLKPRPSLILAFFLALDPGLVALSRQAGSPILALTFVFLAWGFWDHRHSRWAGVFAGMALLSGSSLWEGLLGLGLTWLIRQGMEHGSQMESAERPVRSEWWNALWFGLGTIIVVGTLFFLAPNGLSAWLSSLPEYLRGWIQPSGVSSGMMLFSLVAYQPLAVILGLIALARGWIYRSPRAVRLSLWMLVALLVVLFYPARQVSDLAWMLIPLWSLAALELARNLRVFPEERREVLGVVAMCVLILVFMWLDFISLLQTFNAADQAALRSWLLFGAFFLLVISILLVAVGWSISSAKLGAVWGLVVAVGIYSFSAMTGAAGLRVSPTAEMWNPGSTVPQANLLLKTVSQMSDWSDKNIDSQTVMIDGINSPALQWLLREHKLDVVDALDASASPPIVVTANQNNPKLAAGYRGQSFVWRQTPLWNQAQLIDWMNWLAYRRMPQNSETIIVWVRDDLFLDSATPKP
ncbi:MAG: hypothetical protein M1282_16160 [Chloroflexi bacterium]|nr:hypothetical protein [Chloroflexota bacterium]